ncbi:MAG: pyruvate formate lyase activating enzyme, partial [Nitrososphaerota archaeon]
MASFESLWIWDDERVKERLNWYLAVSTNRLPAKNLICRRIPAEFDPTDEENELWKIHQRCAEKFQEVLKAIRDEDLRLEELEIPTQSLLDLKLELVRRMLRHCNFCRWKCGVDRVLEKKVGTCQLGKDSRVSTYFHHM